MKIKDKQMRMQWVMLALVVVIAITNVNSLVWVWIVTILCLLISIGLFIAEARQNYGLLETYVCEEKNFELEKEEVVKGLTCDGYVPAKEGVRILYGRSGTLFVLCKGAIEKMGTTVQITTRETLKIVTFENYVALIRKGHIASDIVFVRG